MLNNFQQNTTSNVQTGTGTQLITKNEWDSFVNYDYRYIISYPPVVEVENIKLADYVNDVSKGTGRHTDNICIKIKYESAWADIYINPKDPNINKFCGKYEFKSNENLTRKQIQINEKSYAVQVTDEGLHFLSVSNGDMDIKIEYGNDNLKESETDLKIIEQVLISMELL
jgi:hypothetical protein